MNRLKIILKENTTLHEMLLGIAFSNIVILIISLLVCSDKLSGAIGTLIGALISCFYVIHMAVTLDDALNLDEKGAASQMRRNMLIRYFAVCLLLGAVCFFKIGNPICCIFGCLTVKLGAYLQPMVHKIFNRSAKDDLPLGDGSEKGGKVSE